MIDKRGNILTENIVFLIITLLFIAMLFAFVAGASSKVSLVEEAQAKKIALILDSARPGTLIFLNIEDLLDKKEIGISDGEVVTIIGNSVKVQLSEDSGKSYSFFNAISPELKINQPTVDGDRLLKITIN